MLPAEYKKRSFLKFDVPIDLKEIRKEYQSIPADAWASSYWVQHCSIGTLLLRGGNTGTETDYWSKETVDHPLLATLPTIKALLEKDGPFGGAVYAFIFRTQPNGVTLIHRDEDPRWENMFRIHIPIETNSGAYLISDGLSMHFSAGHAWSFDNYTQHGVVNGPHERIHLIFDVLFNKKLADRIDNAEFHPGEEIFGHWQKITNPKYAINPYPGDKVIAEAINEMRMKGMDDGAIATNLNKKGFPTKEYITKKAKQVPKKWNYKMVAKF